MMCLSLVNSAVVIRVAQPVRMLAGGLQPHQIDDVDDPDFQLGQMLAQDGNRRQNLQRRRVAAARHHHVRLAALIVAGPLPDAEAFRAMHDGGIHAQPLRQRVFAGHHHVDVIPAAQAMIEHRQQAIRIGRQVNPDDIGLLVDHVVKEAGILVREAVVILLPDMRGEQIVQRCDWPAPRQFPGDLQPFRVLAEHRVDDADERLITVEHPVPSGQQVSFQPTLALVLAEHRVQHEPGGREEFVVAPACARPTAGWSPRRPRPKGSTASRPGRIPGNFVPPHSASPCRAGTCPAPSYPGH